MWWNEYKKELPPEIIGCSNDAKVKLVDPVEGKVGDNITYKLDKNGVLYISGYGCVGTFSDNPKVELGNEYPWKQFPIKKIVINEGIEQIADNTFYAIGQDYDEIILPESLKKIGYRAFEGGIKVKKINIPSEIQEIDGLAFDSFISLKELTLPEKITILENAAFTNCQKLSKIKILSRTIDISNWVFDHKYIKEIEGYKGSTAEKYANNMGIKFIALGEKESNTKEDQTSGTTGGEVSGTTDNIFEDTTMTNDGKTNTSQEIISDGEDIMEKKIETIKNDDGKNIKVTIIMKKDFNGKITEIRANFCQTGKKVNNKIQGIISNKMISQIINIVGTDQVLLSVKVKNGNKFYIVSMNIKDWKAGTKYNVFAKDAGSYRFVNKKIYLINQKENIKLVLDSGEKYCLKTEAETKAIEESILHNLKLTESFVILKKGECKKNKINGNFDLRNVSKITYSTSDKRIASVNKNGKVTAKKSGTILIKVKIFFKNGISKILKYKVKVKS